MKYKMVLVLLLANISISQVKAVEEGSQIPVYPKAKNYYELYNIDDNVKEIYFYVEEDFYKSDVLKYYINNLGPSWENCKNQGNWETYLKESGNNSVLIFRKIHYWSHVNKKSVLTMQTSYISKSISNNQAPDNNHKHVDIVQKIVMNTQDFFKSIGLQCATHNKSLGSDAPPRPSSALSGAGQL